MIPLLPLIWVLFHLVNIGGITIDSIYTYTDTGIYYLWYYYQSELEVIL